MDILNRVLMMSHERSKRRNEELKRSYEDASKAYEKYRTKAKKKSK